MPLTRIPRRVGRKLVRKYGKKKPMYRRRRYIRKTNVPDVASLSVVVPLADLNTNTTYNYETFRLSDSARAAAVAKGYQQFRIVNIRLTWKPLYDSYVPGVTPTKPVLYYQIDKSRSIADTFTLANLKEMGCRPRALDEKPIVVSWKPGVMLTADDPTAVPQAVRYSPWLTTNANATVPGASWSCSDVNHQGIKFCIESADGATNTPVEIQAEYQIEFKKPNWFSSSSVTAQGMVLAK